jgi:hypothetical protein
MVKILYKIHNYLLLENFNDYPIFNSKYRWKIYNFLNDLLFPLDEKSKFKLKDLWGKHSLIGKISLIILSILLSGFIFGTIITYNKMKKIEEKSKMAFHIAEHFYEMNKVSQDSLMTILSQKDSLLDYFNSREWKEYVIFKESHIDIPDNLPDSIFYIMENERIKNDIPNSIFWRLIQKESSYRMIENEKSGAYGYMQIMPSTFDYIGDKIGICDHNPKNNIIVGTYILKQNFNKFKKEGFNDKKSWELALSSYNAGIKPVLQAGYNIPDYEETKNYVSFILKNFNSV